MKTLLISLLIFSNINAFTQAETQSEINRITFKSKTLADDRELIIYLPKNYSNAQHYPVSYLLDGEELFESHKDVIEFLSDKNTIPQLIIVAIINKNRSLDLTHSSDSTTNFQPNGGGGAFENFLIQEVIPFIDSSYSTAPYRILTGHSISGLFATNILLNSSKLFNAFLLLDPALWWNDVEVLKRADVQLNNPNLMAKKVFLGIANSLPSHIKSISEGLRDTSNGTLGFRSVFMLSDKMGRLDIEKESWKSHYYPDESHGTVPFISTYDGLKFIFDFYKRPSFQTLTDSSHIILENHYKKISEKMGYQILPPVNDLSGLAWRCQELEQNHSRAFNFLEMYIKYYPQDAIAYIQMGQHYDLIGEPDTAQEFYQMGIDRGFVPNNE